MSKSIKNERRRCAVTAASARSISPVKAALQAMQSDMAERREIEGLRVAIEAQIKADIALLDRRAAGDFRL